jgi:4-coumarate--CoA ligase
MKSLILTRGLTEEGFQVAPAELEGHLLAREDVMDVCVIGVWDSERQSEVPRAYVVLPKGVNGNDAMVKDISDWLAHRVAPHKRLRGGVRFIDEVPKSQAGKILRRVLKDKAKAEEQPSRSKL